MLQRSYKSFVQLGALFVDQLSSVLVVSAMICFDFYEDHYQDFELKPWFIFCIFKKVFYYSTALTWEISSIDWW